VQERGGSRKLAKWTGPDPKSGCKLGAGKACAKKGRLGSHEKQRTTRGDQICEEVPGSGMRGGKVEESERRLEDEDHRGSEETLMECKS